MQDICDSDHSVCTPFISKIAKLALQPHILHPAHSQGNILDLALTNKALVKSVKVFDPVLSDHNIILLERDMPKPISQKECSREYNYRKADLDKSIVIFEKWEKQIMRDIEHKKPINVIYDLFSQGLKATRCLFHPKSNILVQ